MAGDGLVLWRIHEVHWGDAVGGDVLRSLWEEHSRCEDRRVFLVEGEARRAVEAGVLSERSVQRAEVGRDEDGGWLPDLPVEWRPTTAGDPTWESDVGGHRSSKWVVDEWETTYFVVPLTLARN